MLGVACPMWCSPRIRTRVRRWRRASTATPLAPTVEAGAAPMQRLLRDGEGSREDAYAPPVVRAVPGRALIGLVRWSRVVETTGLEPTTPACNALRGVGGRSCGSAYVQVTWGLVTVAVRIGPRSSPPVRLPGWLPNAPGGSARHETAVGAGHVLVDADRAVGLYRQRSADGPWEPEARAPRGQRGSSSGIVLGPQVATDEAPEDSLRAV
jgi:hypothetical protein